jgi:hypothetical protein
MSTFADGFPYGVYHFMSSLPLAKMEKIIEDESGKKPLIVKVLVSNSNGHVFTTKRTLVVMQKDLVDKITSFKIDPYNVFNSKANTFTINRPSQFPDADMVDEITSMITKLFDAGIISSADTNLRSFDDRITGKPSTFYLIDFTHLPADEKGLLRTFLDGIYHVDSTDFVSFLKVLPGKDYGSYEVDEDDESAPTKKADKKKVPKKILKKAPKDSSDDEKPVKKSPKLIKKTVKPVEDCDGEVCLPKKSEEVEDVKPILPKKTIKKLVKNSD